jgi:hypothetical protein
LAECAGQEKWDVGQLCIWLQCLMAGGGIIITQGLVID